MLRPWAATDAPAFLKLVESNREHLGQYMPWALSLSTLQQAEGRIAGCRWAAENDEHYIYGIFAPDPVGEVGIHAPSIYAQVLLPPGTRGSWSMSYWVGSQAQGTGLAYKAAKRLLDAWMDGGVTGQQHSPPKLFIEPGNERSVRLAQRLGYRHDLFSSTPSIEVYFYEGK